MIKGTIYREDITFLNLHIQITADKYIKQRLRKMLGKLDKNTNHVQDFNSISQNYRFSKQSTSKGRGLCNATNK